MISVAEYKAQLELKEKKHRRQPEGQLQMTIGQLLNGIYKPRLSPDLIFWTYSGAGEKKGKTAIWHYKKGLQKADADYRFELRRKANNTYYQHMVYIETKAQKGSLSPEQKIFREKHQNLENVSYYIAKSVEETIKILENEGVIV